MTPDKDMERRLEQQARWFGETIQDEPIPPLEQIKRRVHIEANEQWLAGQIQDHVPLGLADGVKRRIRGALAAAQHDRDLNRSGQTVGTSIRPWLCWAGGAAVAAAACVLFVVSHSPQPSVAEEWWRIDAFEQFSMDELTCSLAALADDIDDTERAFYQSDKRDLNEALVEELFEAIEGVMEDHGRDDDWLLETPTT